MIICKPTFTSPLVRSILIIKQAVNSFSLLNLVWPWVYKNILWALKTIEIEFIHLAFEYSRIYSEILITIPNS